MSQVQFAEGRPRKVRMTEINPDEKTGSTHSESANIQFQFHLSIPETLPLKFSFLPCKDEGNAISNWSDDIDPPIRVHRGPVQEIQYQISRNAELRDSEVHHALRHDLMEHIWERYNYRESN
ncbi:hypothetical protein LXL04_025100 [Taraxacum kok-saghyz]